jgi:hypothetical protein
MKLEHSVRYDAPIADVYAMLTDPAFREKATWAQGSISVDVEVDGPNVTIDMAQELTDIPSFAKPIAGEKTRAVQAEVWHDGEWADFSVESPPMPIGIRGTRRLVADGDGTLDTFDGEARAKLPLVGKKIEQLISDRLRDGWDTEHGVGVAWLAGER